MNAALPPHLNVLHGEYLLLRDWYLEKKCTHTELSAALDRYHAAIAAHVAAEVAAERAKHVVPQVVRSVAGDAAKARELWPEDTPERENAATIRAWLASLPPITPEGLIQLLPCRVCGTVPSDGVLPCTQPKWAFVVDCWNKICAEAPSAYGQTESEAVAAWNRDWAAT